MAYYTKVLLPDEQVRVLGKLHWAIYLKSWTALLFGAAATAVALYYRNLGSADREPAEVSIPLVLGGVGGLLLVIGIISGLGAWGRRVTTEIVVTDRRVIFKRGFIQRRTMEMNMNKVETVDVSQSIGGRLFNYGTILIRGTGSSYEPLSMIADPLAIRTAIVAQ